MTQENVFWKINLAHGLFFVIIKTLSENYCGTFVSPFDHFETSVKVGTKPLVYQSDKTSNLLLEFLDSFSLNNLMVSLRCNLRK